MSSNLKELYQKTIIEQLKKQFKYKSVMEVPRIVKITLSMGVGEAILDKKQLDFALEDLELISGQKPVSTSAKKSIAGFKVREGFKIGCKVTLRRERMYEFLERLIKISIPRIRDFRGFSKHAFDEQGNYNLGIREQIVFPEIDYDKINKIRGLNIAITTTAKTKEEGQALLTAFSFPFKE